MGKCIIIRYILRQWRDEIASRSAFEGILNPRDNIIWSGDENFNRQLH